MVILNILWPLGLCVKAMSIWQESKDLFPTVTRSTSDLSFLPLIWTTWVSLPLDTLYHAYLLNGFLVCNREHWALLRELPDFTPSQKVSSLDFHTYIIEAESHSWSHSRYPIWLALIYCRYQSDKCFLYYWRRNSRSIENCPYENV